MCENTEEAEKLGALIIENKIGACVDFWPIKSCYNWDGAFKCLSQIMLMVTTFESKIDSVTNIINDNHTYSVPLIAGVDVRRVNHPYKEWMMKEIH
ncbi:MAG: divalent-cation tolerance protein CutA [Patescibacteria group bacterium]|nr:divalent-cation tolerance protein CutA [Patescibacteria group bacterium]